MKLSSIVCMQCFQDEKPSIENIYSVELNDNNVYTVTCVKGHLTHTYLQEQKFEILFEIGLSALLDGYADAAVSRFAAGLERFYEFCIYVWLFSCGLKDSEIDTFWKQIKANSQAQLGSFLALLAREKATFPGVPYPPTQKWAEFRNSVVHNGRIPSYKECYDYANETYIFMQQMLRHLKTNRSADVDAATFRHLNIVNAAIEKDAFRQGMTMPTAINLARALSEADIDFTTAVTNAKNFRAINPSS